MMLMIAAALMFGLTCVLFTRQAVRRSRRRRWRADRKQRHARIAREWAFLQKVFGPRPKRLTFEPAERDRAPD